MLGQFGRTSDLQVTAVSMALQVLHVPLKATTPYHPLSSPPSPSTTLTSSLGQAIFFLNAHKSQHLEPTYPERPLFLIPVLCVNGHRPVQTKPFFPTFWTSQLNSPLGLVYYSACRPIQQIQKHTIVDKKYPKVVFLMGVKLPFYSFQPPKQVIESQPDANVSIYQSAPQRKGTLFKSACLWQFMRDSAQQCDNS